MKIVGLHSALRTAILAVAFSAGLSIAGHADDFQAKLANIARPATVCRAKVIMATTPCLGSRDSNPNTSRTSCGRSSSTGGKTRSWPMWRMRCRRRCCRRWLIISGNSTRHRWAAGDRAAQWPWARRIYEEGLPESNVPACSACHGPDAKGQDQIPRLAGQLPDYFYAKLVNWSAERGQNSSMPDSSAVMGPTSHNLTKSQIAAVAAYVSGLR